jgi:electron transfer flavoprotein alpha/beta subunit
MSTPKPASTTTEAPEADAEAIDWDNVAVETAVMLRLQQAPSVVSARQSKPQANG